MPQIWRLPLKTLNTIIGLCFLIAISPVCGCQKNIKDGEKTVSTDKVTERSETKEALQHDAAKPSEVTDKLGENETDKVSDDASAKKEASNIAIIKSPDDLTNAQKRFAQKYNDQICPAGANKVDGKCQCPAAEGKGAEGPCHLKPEFVTQSGKDFKCIPNFWECMQTVMCINPDGCDAPDGRHFGPNYEGSYIRAGVDTILESGPGGECVIQRTDDIKPYSQFRDQNGEFPKIESFICDLPYCTCSGTVRCNDDKTCSRNETTCILGEICRSGKCEIDNTPDPVLTENNRTEIDTNSLPYYFDVPKYMFDYISCPGGAIMCKGRDNAGLKKPSEGNYQCKSVKSLPGYPEKSSLKAWVCEVESCPCGERICQKGQVCADGTVLDSE